MTSAAHLRGRPGGHGWPQEHFHPLGGPDTDADITAGPRRVHSDPTRNSCMCQNEGIHRRDIKLVGQQQHLRSQTRRVTMGQMSGTSHAVEAQGIAQDKKAFLKDSKKCSHVQ